MVRKKNIYIRKTKKRFLMYIKLSIIKWFPNKKAELKKKLIRKKKI